MCLLLIQVTTTEPIAIKGYYTSATLCPDPDSGFMQIKARRSS